MLEVIVSLVVTVGWRRELRALVRQVTSQYLPMICYNTVVVVLPGVSCSAAADSQSRFTSPSVIMASRGTVCVSIFLRRRI
jgi:hypothetical protein